MGGTLPEELNREKNIVETGMMYDLDFPGENYIALLLIPDESVIEKLVSNRFNI